MVRRDVGDVVADNDAAVVVNAAVSAVILAVVRQFVVVNVVFDGFCCPVTRVRGRTRVVDRRVK